MVHLIRRLASVIALLFLLCSLTACTKENAARRALAEANPLSSAIYDIEIVGQNGLAQLAYKTEVTQIEDKAQWNGLATIGAYNMIFQQNCVSLYSSSVQAKFWRGKWAYSTATCPSQIISIWLQDAAKGAGKFMDVPVAACTLPQFDDSDQRLVIYVTLTNARINWDAICDAHIDTMFGSQAFLTELKNATVTLLFDASTSDLICVSFYTEKGSSKVSGIIEVSSAGGHSLGNFPEPDALSEGTLHEEWEIINPEETRS